MDSSSSFTLSFGLTIKNVTTCYRVFCEKLTKKFPVHMEHKSSLPCLQSLIIEPVLSHFNPVHIFTTYFSKIHFHIILLSTPVAPKHSPSLTFSNAKLLCFLYPQCPAHLSFSDLIIQYYTNSTICKVYHYVIFFILLLSMNKYSCKELGDTIARLVKWPTVTE